MGCSFFFILFMTTFTVVFYENPVPWRMEVRERFSSLEALNQYLASFDDWELEAYNLRVERSDYGYDPVVPF